jgi:hypothetical protein
MRPERPRRRSTIVYPISVCSPGNGEPTPKNLELNVYRTCALEFHQKGSVEKSMVDVAGDVGGE